MQKMTPQALQLQAPSFDELASGYDSTFTTSALGQRLRTLAWERLDVVLAGCGRVLEIGCGTGEDAVRLARRGVDVLATDPSASMLRVAAEKAKHMGCTERIDFRCVPMENLGAQLAGERFDGVWSNFGAINCVPRLDAVVADVRGPPQTRRAAGLGRHGTARSVGVALVYGARQPG